MSPTARSGGRESILYSNQLSSILLACQVFISNFKSKNYGADDTWHLWAHGLLYLFLNISRAQGLSFHLAIYYSAQLPTCQQAALFLSYVSREISEQPYFIFPDEQTWWCNVSFLVLYSLDLFLLTTAESQANSKITFTFFPAFNHEGRIFFNLSDSSWDTGLLSCFNSSVQWGF